MNAVFGLAAVALALAMLIRLVRRYRAASPPLRRVLAPIYVFSAIALVGLIVSNAVGSFSEAGSTVLGMIAVLGLGLVPLAFLAGLLRSRLARASLAGMVLDIQGGTALNDALANALGDPSLEVAYRLPGSAQWVDAAGHRVPEPESSPGRAVTLVERTGLPIAALVHDSSLTEDNDLVEAVAAAAGLSLQNERLQAELRAQFEIQRTITDTAPSLLVNVGTDGRIRNQNRAAIIAAGVRDQEEIRGRTSGMSSSRPRSATP